MSVPRETAFREFTRLNLRPVVPPGDKPLSPRATTSASTSAPRRSSTGPSAFQFPARPAARVRAPEIPLTSGTDSEDEPLLPSGEPSDDDDTSVQASPQQIHHPDPSSPTDDVRSFNEHIIKMSRALGIDLSYPEEEARDPVEHWVHGRVPTPPSIPLLPSFDSIVRRSWDTPTSLVGSSRKIEALYRISPSSCSWLTDHSRQNSAIVEGAQQTFVPKQATSPADREAKKIDGLARKAYSASAPVVKAINYTACMGAYVQTLMEGISPLVPDVPDEVQRRLVEIRDEAHSVESWLITASRNVADCAGQAMSASLALCQHAWLRGSDLNASVKSTIEDMPLDSTGLFHADTDERLNRKFRMKAAVRKHGMSSSSIQPFRKRQRQWQPQGPVVRDGRLEGCLLPHRNSGVPQEIPRLRRRLHRIPLQRAPLWPCHGSEGLHKVHGANGGVPSSEGLQGLPLPGRLAVCRRLTAGPPRRNLIRLAPFGLPRTGRQRGEVSLHPDQTGQEATPFSLQTVSRHW
ncbi:uncharacterized protein LOC121932301 isoform X2 [Sceloporus undulatus]|uniref:uncharacterized protein LOC121932301 isoform X2 n=1 Tax=Sceloporus undulatus TaxID=8520 RepID=UPI001C4CD7EB|nr:uncharacterized protein LOC121932301 isoform X2 [Sceloporus undulatus]